jgi:hypothetical protein
MKAQRRHELQENELAKAIKKAPTLWQQSGGKFLALLIAILVIVILIRYRISSGRESRAQAIDSLAQARTEIAMLEQTAPMGLMGPAEEAATQRRQFFNDANAALSRAMTLSDDHKLQAESLVARGDLNWTAATLPEIAGAATQPSLQLKNPKDLLDAAAEAYQTVLNSYSDEVYAAIAARFGLASIDENKHDFDAARAQYEALLKMTGDFPGYRQIAQQRLDRLSTLRNPVIIGKPATQPALGTPTTQAATQPLPAGIAAPAPHPAPPSHPQATQPTTRK